MKIISSYALSTGLFAKKPDILQEYVPFSKDLSKVVFFNFNSPHQSKTYDYGQDVLDIVTPILEKYGFITIQLGGEKDGKLKTQYSLLGMSYAQKAFLIERAALVVSIDNALLHYAGIYDTKSIGIYGATHPNSHGPAWGRHLAIRNAKDKPSYLPQEFPKSINENKPEEIANAIINQLSIDEKINQKSVFFGANYPSLVLELVPDHLIPKDLFEGKDVIVRMDYKFNEECLLNMGKYRKISIISNNPINIDIIKSIKKNILIFNLKIDKNSDIIYCKKLKETGAKIVFFSEEQGDDLIKTRAKFFDVGLVESFIKTQKPLDFDATKNNISFKSYKFLLSDGKVYLSQSHWKQNKPIESFNQNESDLIDDEDFWKDLDLFYIYKK